MSDRTQHKIGRNRPPRVQITYDVETGDAMEVKELPFIVGILADLSGHTKADKFKDRKFVQVDKDNFGDVMEGLAPSLSFPVPNRLDDSSDNIAVDLKFRSIKDFEPMSIVKQVDKLREAYEKRQSLNALLAKIYTNDDLASALNDVIASSASDDELKGKLNELLKKL